QGQIGAAEVQASYLVRGNGRTLPDALTHPRLDSSGRCTVTGLFAEHEVDLCITVPGATVDPASRRLSAVARDEAPERLAEFRVVPRRSCEVRGRLLDAGSVAMPSQTLVLGGGLSRPGIGTALTDAEGRFVLPGELPSGAHFDLRLASTKWIL